MKYKVKFREIITQEEINEVIVEADSENEAKEKIEDYDYDKTISQEINVINLDNFEICELKLIE